jgi:hypothetical protein
MGASEVEVTDEVRALALQLAQAKAKELVERRAELKVKYPHAKPETLQFDASANKYSVEIVCVKCGGTRRVFTSDLFQVSTCLACSKAAKADRKAAKKELLAKAIALIEAGEVK